MAKKRRRSESFQADGNDARKRLAAFHARMFELPQEDAPVATPETPRVVFKAKTKKHKKRSSDADDGERVPMVKFNKVRNKKEKKKNVVNVAEKKVAVGPAVVKVPGMPNGFRKKPQKNNVEEKKKQKLKNTAVQTTQYQSLLTEKEQDDEDDGVDPLEQALSSVKAMVTEKKARKVKKMALPAPQPHMKKETEEEEDEMDPLGQALGRIKEMATKQGAKPMLKQNKGMAVASSSVEKAEDSVEVVEEQSGTKELAVNNSTGDGSNPALSMSKKKKRKKLTRAQEAKNSDPAPENIQATMNEAAKATSGVTEKSQAVNKVMVTKDSNTVLSKAAKTTPVKKDTTAIKTAVSNKNVIRDEEKETVISRESMTPIVASLAKDAKQKSDMFLPAQETPRKPAVLSKSSDKSVPPRTPAVPDKSVPPPVAQFTDASSSSESDDERGFDFDHCDDNNSSLFSRLIDSAARERWELVEVGRLVRLFAAEWGFKESKTARFLLDTCPELVSVDFLEGLGVNLSAKQLIQVFEAGSGNSSVLMNKMASAVENGHLSVRDPSFVSALERRVALMESNAEVMELLHPLLESLSTVRDVGCLLKQLCEHWQLERKIGLVQQVLLSSIFDDLDGNQDEILLDLPDLTGRLDFPSRLDQEDVDENGNLKGFLANEDSEYSGVEGSEEEDEEKDSDDDEDPYEGETDSDEEMEIAGCSRSRNQFIEDEADVGEEDEEEEEEDIERHDGGESSSDSD
ncbi:hypothetical protein PPTG_14780 [Phytophthora nicotianae INRA-310]|uniref:Uncharacterized protein n=1 Tax=Phytophthora nicotianae (strain INRA-310) TaxID=761204 RepID=W2PVW1_PHYN3|nr:hypothetical protein PPTG_14780 [Phytophthora nicotianae INRA-310]ETN05103.1 hypothetical protein PPTG_14780 [Phytophthora nicotianae INRA-310]